MKADNLRHHSPSELEALIAEQRHILDVMRFTNRLSPVENPSRIRAVRRDIARMITVLNEKQTAVGQ